MKVVDALQYVHRLVDVATIVVVSELLDTADDVSLSGEILDLVLELGGEDATYVFALELGSVAGEVLLDVLVDGVVRYEELLATPLGRLAGLPEVSEDFDRVDHETGSEHATDAVLAQDLFGRGYLAHGSLRKVHVAVGREEGDARYIVLVVPDPIADYVPLVVGDVDGVGDVVLDRRLHVGHAGDDPALLYDLDVLEELDATEFATKEGLFTFLDREEDLLIGGGLEDVRLDGLGVRFFVGLEVRLFDVGFHTAQVALSIGSVDAGSHTKEKAHRTVGLDTGRAGCGVDAKDACTLGVLLAHLHRSYCEDILVGEDLGIVHDPADGDTDEGVGLDDVGRGGAEVGEVHVGSLHGSQRRGTATDLVELLLRRALKPVDRGEVTYLPARITILIRGEEANLAARVAPDAELISPI